MEEFTTSDKVTIAYEYMPGEDLLVFVHGLMADSRIWEDYVNEFSGDHGILLIDLRGHGQSEAAEDYSLQRMAQDVHELLEELEEDMPVLIGHSMGGMVSMQYITTYQAKKLILISTAARDSEPGGVHEYITRLEKLIAEAPEEIHALEKHGKFRPKEAKGCLEAIHRYDITGELRGNQTEAHIVVGTEDALTPVEFSEEIHKILPNSELTILHGAEHILPVTHKDEVMELIRKSL